MDIKSTGYQKIQASNPDFSHLISGLEKLFTFGAFVSLTIEMELLKHGLTTSWRDCVDKLE